MKRILRIQHMLIILLVLGLGLTALPQSRRRQKQIKSLVKNSDLVVLAESEAYSPIVDLEKYRRAREQRRGLDPRQRSEHTYGTVYRLRVKDVLFQKPQKDPDKPQHVFRPQDGIEIYVKGPPAHPLQLGQATFFPSADYVVFLKRAKLDRDDFRRGVKQDLNAPQRQWKSFPHPDETYFKVLDDPLAARLIDEVWQEFPDHIRLVVSQMAASKKRE